MLNHKKIKHAHHTALLTATPVMPRPRQHFLGSGRELLCGNGASESNQQQGGAFKRL